MAEADLLYEAEHCRHRAHAYVGRPEATFLLSVAQEFERLARERRTEQRADGAAARSKT